MCCEFRINIRSKHDLNLIQLRQHKTEFKSKVCMMYVCIVCM